MSNNNNPVIKMIQEVRIKFRKDLYKAELNHDSAITTLKRHLDVVDQLGEMTLKGQLLETIGTIELERGNFEEAFVYYEDGYQVFEGTGDEVRVGMMLNSLGEAYRHMGNYNEAANYYIRAREIAIRNRNYPSIIMSYNNEGQARLAAGFVDEAIELLKKGLVVNSESGEFNIDVIQSTLPEIHSSLAMAYCRKDEYAEAWDNVQRALEIAGEFRQVTQMARAHHTMAYIAMRDSNFTGDIHNYFEQSKSLWRTLDSKVELGRTLALEGDYWLQLDDQAQANLCYQEAMNHLAKAKLDDEVAAIRQRMS
jgi:G-protein signaling modulator 2